MFDCHESLVVLGELSLQKFLGLPFPISPVSGVGTYLKNSLHGPGPTSFLPFSSKSICVKLGTAFSLLDRCNSNSMLSDLAVGLPRGPPPQASEKWWKKTLANFWLVNELMNYCNFTRPMQYKKHSLDTH